MPVEVPPALTHRKPKIDSRPNHVRSRMIRIGYEDQAVDNVINVMRQGVIGALVLGIFIYAVFMLLYALGWSETATKLMTSGDPSYMFGLPISGVTAFAIVSLLERIAPSTKDPSGKLEFKAFGLTFSGPAGPVTLWIVVYLVLVTSMRIAK
jgi:hypothetical protein